VTSRRSYDQYCAVARGLDVIGERWTLLLVRDLLLGPKRYKELLAGLPGMGTNLLAARLRELEEYGIVERVVLPPPAGSTVYQLTEVGKGLEPVVFAIGRWGIHYLGKPRRADNLVPTAYFLAIRARLRPEAAAGVHERWEFRIGYRVFQVEVADGTCRTIEGRFGEPDTVFRMDGPTLHGLLFNELSPAPALSSGRVQATGDPKALERFIRIFGLSREREAILARRRS
jgi:DNA-binding HxlR family transcriptional regulator